MQQTPAYDQYNETLLDMIPKGLSRITEIGCMRGNLAQAYLAANPHCQWTGIDIDPDNIQRARAVCHEVYCRDIEQVGDAELAKWSHTDAWIFGDTLEHLQDPWRVLTRIRQAMTQPAYVIASIPNTQHWSVQARLNVGLFRYENEGLFDRTHLRFFTRTTISELFESTGYRLDNAVSRVFNFPGLDNYIPHIRAMAIASQYDPDQAVADAIPYQYIVRAVPVISEDKP
ncbi:MAG: class I SAM-dependent methyltransferase [Methylococcaceae bacterium]